MSSKMSWKGSASATAASVVALGSRLGLLLVGVLISVIRDSISATATSVVASG